MSRLMSPRLRWYALVSCVGFPTGVVAAVGVLLLSSVQTALGLSGAVLLSPLVLGPLAAFLVMRQVMKPSAALDGLLGLVLFGALAFPGELSIATWIAMLDHP